MVSARLVFPALCAAFWVAGGVVGCDTQKPTTRGVQKSATGVHPPPSVSAATPTTPNVATNFPMAEFTVPPQWGENYRVDQRLGKDADQLVPDALRTVEYIYSPQDAALGEQSLFLLITLTKESWNRSLQAPGPSLGEVVAERGNYLIVATLAREQDYPETSQDAHRYNDLKPSVEAIKAALTFSTATEPSVAMSDAKPSNLPSSPH